MSTPPSTQEERILERRKAIGRRVRQLREEQGLSQDTLAHLSGLNRAYPYRIEEGLVDLRFSTLMRLAEALQIEVSQLVAADSRPEAQ